MTWIQNALDFGVWLDLWRHGATRLEYVWHWGFAPLVLTSPGLHRAKITARPCFHGQPGCDSSLKVVDTSAGLSSCSKQLPRFTPALVPDFTQECVGQGDFIRTIDNGGHIYDLTRYYPDCKTTWSRAWTWKRKQANGLERDSVARGQAETASREPSLKHTAAQLACW